MCTFMHTHDLFRLPPTAHLPLSLHFVAHCLCTHIPLYSWRYTLARRERRWYMLMMNPNWSLWICLSWCCCCKCDASTIWPCLVAFARIFHSHTLCTYNARDGNECLAHIFRPFQIDGCFSFGCHCQLDFCHHRRTSRRAHTHARLTHTQFSAKRTLADDTDWEIVATCARVSSPIICLLRLEIHRHIIHIDKRSFDGIMPRPTKIDRIVCAAYSWHFV